MWSWLESVWSLQWFNMSSWSLVGLRVVVTQQSVILLKVAVIQYVVIIWSCVEGDWYHPAYCHNLKLCWMLLLFGISPWSGARLKIAIIQYVVMIGSWAEVYCDSACVHDLQLDRTSLWSINLGSCWRFLSSNVSSWSEVGLMIAIIQHVVLILSCVEGFYHQVCCQDLEWRWKLMWSNMSS